MTGDDRADDGGERRGVHGQPREEATGDFLIERLEFGIYLLIKRRQAAVDAREPTVDAAKALTDLLVRAFKVGHADFQRLRAHIVLYRAKFADGKVRAWAKTRID